MNFNFVKNLNKSKIIINLLVFSLLLLLFIQPAYAQYDPPAVDLSNLQEAAGKIQYYMIGIALVVVLFMGPYAFILMATGNPDQIKKGRDLLFALISGFLVVVFASTFIRIIGADLLALE